MPLSALHRTFLDRYKRFRDEPPTIWRLMKVTMINHAAILMVVSAAVAIMLATEIPSAAWFFVGMGFGVLCRDLGVFRRLVQVWPVLLTIIDWHKVDQVLTGEVEVQTSATR